MKFPGVVEGRECQGHDQGHGGFGERAGGVRRRAGEPRRRDRRPTTTAWWWCRRRRPPRSRRRRRRARTRKPRRARDSRPASSGLDIYDMRDKLKAAGLVYYERSGRREVSRREQDPDKTCLPPDPNPVKPKLAAAARRLRCALPRVRARQRSFPTPPDRSYTPPDAPVEQLRALHAHLGISRAVIVHASCHGSDMDVTLDAIASSGGLYRGVAVVEEAVTDASSSGCTRAASAASASIS